MLACLVCIAGRVGLSGYLRNSVSRPMSDEADVDKACVREKIVFGLGYAGTVREVRGILHCVCA